MITSPLCSVEESIDTLLNDFLEQMTQQVEFNAGYSENLAFDYSRLWHFLRYNINNAGDPFIYDKFVKSHAKEFEQKSLQWFAQLYELQNHWGYVTTGGSEGNIYGLFLGRERYPDSVFYASKDSHYSIVKAARLLRIPYTPIDSQLNGEIDYEQLERELSTHRHQSAILNLNLGTTMKGAIDRIERVVDILKQVDITQFHLHCDAALGGMLLPFIDGAPKISFQDYPIGSIAVSGHKFIGSPIHFGIVLTRREYVQKIGKRIEYLGTDDTTITGSRCGLNALFLWYAIATRGQKFAREVATCLENAQYLRDRLQQIGYNPLLNDFSITVAFKKPPAKVCDKWQLAIEGNLAHVVVMQHISTQKINELIDDLLQAQA
jgi:histidine decarboxylase